MPIGSGDMQRPKILSTLPLLLAVVSATSCSWWQLYSRQHDNFGGQLLVCCVEGKGFGVFFVYWGYPGEHAW